MVGVVVLVLDGSSKCRAWVFSVCGDRLVAWRAQPYECRLAGLQFYKSCDVILLYIFVQ